MAQNIWLWIAGLAVVLVGGFLGYRVLYPQSVSNNSTASPSPSSSATSSCLPKDDLATTVTLEYRDRKFFAPGATEATTVICIPVGGTVTWVNKSSDPMWIASVPHPTHTDYPGFDSLGAKDSYAFTFERAGDWGFHNHLRASDTGSIVVVE